MTATFEGKDKERLETLLRNLESGEGGEIVESVKHMRKIFARHGLSFGTLADHPERLTGHVSSKDMEDMRRLNEELFEANRGLAEQVDAVIEENTRLRKKPLHKKLAERFNSAAATLSDNPLARAGKYAAGALVAASYAFGGPLGKLPHKAFFPENYSRESVPFGRVSDTFSLLLQSTTLLMFSALCWTPVVVTDDFLKGNAVERQAREVAATLTSCTVKKNEALTFQECGSAEIQKPAVSPLFGFSASDGPMIVTKKNETEQKRGYGNGESGRTISCSQEVIEVSRVSEKTGFSHYKTYRDPVKCETLAP